MGFGENMTEEEVRELLQGEFTLDIPNFEKWNPPILNKAGAEHERQFRSYIKLSVHTFEDPKFAGVSAADRQAWLSLCLRRASNGPVTCQRYASYLPAICQRRASRVPALLLKLMNLQLIDLSKERKKERKKGVRPAAAKVTPSQFDFAPLYQRFPKRPGVERFKAGIKALRRSIKTQAEFDAVASGVAAYAKSREGEDPQFTLGFSTWVENRGWENPPPTKAEEQQIVNWGGGYG